MRPGARADGERTGGGSPRVVAATRTTRCLSALKVVGVPLGVAALCYWAVQDRALRAGSGLNGMLLLGTVVSQISAALFALRLRRVMRIVGVRLGVLEGFRINTQALFYGFFVPFAPGSDVARYVQIRRIAAKPAARLAAGGLVLDHLIGVATLLSIAITLWVVAKPIASDVAGDSLVTWLPLALLALPALAVIALRSDRLTGLRRVVTRIPAHGADLVHACLLSATMQILLALAVFIGSRGWHIDVGYLDLLFVLTGSLVFQAIPVNLAGIGVADVAGTGLYLALGLPASDALLLVSLLYFYRLVLALVGGLWQMLPARNDVAAPPGGE